MLEALLSGGLGTLLGGITGLIGTVINNRKELKLAQLEFQERSELRKFELQRMDKAHEYGLATAKVQNEHAQELSADATLRESYTYAKGEIDKTREHGPVMTAVLGVVEALRRLVRVAASYGSMVILGYITYFVYNNLDKFLIQLVDIGDSKAAFGLMEYLVFTICYMSTTVLLWWFGGRAKRPNQLR